MPDPIVPLKVFSSELMNMKQSLDKFYSEYSKRISDMQQSVSVLETLLANDVQGNSENSTSQKEA